MRVAVNGIEIMPVGPPRLISLFGYSTIDNAVPTVVGIISFDPASYEIAGRTTNLSVEAVGSVTTGLLTGTLEVLDSSDVTVASIDWTETDPTKKTDTITLPVGDEIYRVRLMCTGIADPLTDYAIVGGAVLRISWS